MPLSFRLQYVFVHLGKGVSEAVSLLFHPVEHSFRKLHQGILVLTLPVPEIFEMYFFLKLHFLASHLERASLA